MLMTRYGRLDGMASLADALAIDDRLSSSAPVLFRTSSSSCRLSLNTMRLTSRSCRTRAVRANSAVLAAMSSRIAPMSPHAIFPPLRKKLSIPMVVVASDQ